MIIIARFVLLIQVVQPVILDMLLIVNQNVLKAVVKDILDWEIVLPVARNAAVLLLIARNVMLTLMMLLQLFVMNAHTDILAAMVLANHVQHCPTVSDVTLVMLALVALKTIDLIMEFASLNLIVLSETVLLAFQEMQQIVKNVILAILLLLMVHVNWMHAQLVSFIMLEDAVVLLAHIKAVVLHALHAQILTVLPVILSAALHVLVDFILQEVLVLLVLTIAKNVLMVPPARPANLHTSFRVANVSLRVMVQVVLLILVVRFLPVKQDAKHASLGTIIFLSALL